MTKLQKWQKACDEISLQIAKTIIDSVTRMVDLVSKMDIDGARTEAEVTQAALEVLKFQHSIVVAAKPMPKKKFAKGGVIVSIKQNVGESGNELILPLTRKSARWIGDEFIIHPADGSVASYK